MGREEEWQQLGERTQVEADAIAERDAALARVTALQRVIDAGTGENGCRDIGAMSDALDEYLEGDGG